MKIYWNNPLYWFAAFFAGFTIKTAFFPHGFVEPALTMFG